MNALAHQTAAEFEARFGYAPAGVWSAPGRVNLIGEHTDYNEGFVFPFAINRRTYAAIALRADGIARVASAFSADAHEVPLDKIKRDESLDWAAYPLGVAWAINRMATELGRDFSAAGFDCFIESDVPVGAGLSSSAAIECAVATGLNELWDAGLTRSELARAGQLGENEIVGAPTGIMDQSASLLGVADHGVFLDCRSLEAEVVELGFARDGLELLIIDTKVAHRLVDGGYASRRAACEDGAAIMNVSSLRELTESDLAAAEAAMTNVTYRRVKHVVTENARVLETVRRLQETGPRSIGELMYASHKSMRDDFEISVDELDTAVETALRHGAVGARMTGGGFGGAAIALTPIERISEVTNSVYAEFEACGYARPDVFAVSAAEGATREF
ncbi:MAG: galactokinase [Actinomycetales bacterium]|nr:galactokinase [Actinomycetales bacterium]